MHIRDKQAYYKRVETLTAQWLYRAAFLQLDIVERDQQSQW